MLYEHEEYSTKEAGTSKSYNSSLGSFSECSVPRSQDTLIERRPGSEALLLRKRRKPELNHRLAHVTDELNARILSLHALEWSVFRHFGEHPARTCLRVYSAIEAAIVNHQEQR